MTEPHHLSGRLHASGVMLMGCHAWRYVFDCRLLSVYDDNIQELYTPIVIVKVPLIISFLIIFSLSLLSNPYDYAITLE